MKSNYNVLIVANEGLSYNTANGRTLAVLLTNFNKENLYQFYIHDKPDEELIHKSYQVSDYDVLRSAIPFFKKKPHKSVSNASSVKKSCRNLYLRNILWSTYAWWGKEFSLFINNVNPKIIILQAGDAPFMFKIALKICKKTGAKLIVVNTENYVLKEKLYSDAKKYSVWHLLLQHSLNKQFKRIVNKSEYFIFNFEYLQNCYLEKYPKIKSCCSLMNSSTIKPHIYDYSGKFVLSYLGNMGVGRIECLREIAETIDDNNLPIQFVLCGKFPTIEDEQIMRAFKCIDYRGVVQYDEVIDIMKNSSLILHCENTSRLENLKSAFSTKLADMLTVGSPILIYASRDYPFVKYLESNCVGHIASDKKELLDVLIHCIEDYNYLIQYIPNCIELANRNHNVSVNSQKMISIMNNLCGEIYD